ncbi:MAG: diguanylate cyclase [Acidimicrobiales bacterium]
MRLLDGAETAVLGAAATVTGIVGLAAGQPTLGVVAGGLGLTAGLLGWRHAQVAAAPAQDPTSALEALRAAELSEELSLARLREQALNQRIELLENAARAAASSASGLRGALGVDATDENQHLLTDEDTGLFSEAYFDVALEARIAAARRRLRPVALVLLDVVRGLASPEPSSADAELVTAALRRTLREADTACRLDDGRYALVLEDTPENGAIWTVERIRIHLAESGTIHTVWAGIACYPAHAFDKDEILRQAEGALRQAKEWRQDRIEVATAD